MAILTNTTIEKKSGSIGNLTYRTRDGRTIVSKKITSNSSNSPKQAAARKAFGEMSRLATDLDPLNRIGFDRVKYGTSRNQFIRSNKELSNYYRTEDWLTDDMTSVYKLYMALNDPMFMGQVITSEGMVNLQSSFSLHADGVISGEIMLSRDFRRDDRIVIGLGVAFQSKYTCFGILRHYSKTLGSVDIESLTNPRIYSFDGNTFPLANIYQSIPPFGVFSGVIATAIVVGSDDKSMGRFSTVSVVE